jgi:hypothetical protein
MNSKPGRGIQGIPEFRIRIAGIGRPDYGE